jgi:hypothetical protein
MCPRQSSARFFSARLHMTNVARFREYSMRARKKLLLSCSLLKETIFRRGLDADRGIGDIVHRYLASRRRMVFLLTTESVFQGCSGLFLNGSLPRHARCATRGIYNKRAFMCRAMIPAGYLLFCSLRFRASGGQVEMAVGDGATLMSLPPTTFSTGWRSKSGDWTRPSIRRLRTRGA